jgi:hypothetical protein
MRERRSIPFIVASTIIGLAIFATALAVMNRYVPSSNTGFNQVVWFLNENLVLLVVLALIFMVGDIFGTFFFPFNLPAPLFDAVASIFLVKFIINIFGLIDRLAGTANFGFLKSIDILLYIMVFLIVIIVGYIMIIFGLFAPRDYAEGRNEETRRERPKRHPTWEDIGQEIRERIYEGIRRKRR